MHRKTMIVSLIVTLLVTLLVTLIVVVIVERKIGLNNQSIISLIMIPDLLLLMTSNRRR